MENVVCINDDWKWTGSTTGFKNNFPEHPIKGEIYKVISVHDFNNYTGYQLYGFPLRVYGCTHFRPVDLTFGEVVTEVLKEQIEYETVLNKG